MNSIAAQQSAAARSFAEDRRMRIGMSADAARRCSVLIAVMLLSLFECCPHASAQSDLPPYRAIVAVLSGQVADVAPADQVREATRRVMQGNEFRSVRRRVLEQIPHSDADRGFLGKLSETIGGWLESFVNWLFSGSGGGGGGPAPRPAPVGSLPSGSGMNIDFRTLLLTLILAVIGVLVAWLASTIIRKQDGHRRRGVPGVPEEEGDLSNLQTPPGELAVLTYEGRAMQYAEQGNYRLAVRELLLGSMSWVERAGLLRFRKGLTNRDYIRAVWRQTDRRYAFEGTAGHFERIFFGRRAATREIFDDCLSNFRSAFREEATPLAEV